MISSADRIAQVLGPTAARRTHLTATAGTISTAVLPIQKQATLWAGATPIVFELTATSVTAATTASSVYLGADQRFDWEVDETTRRVTVAPATSGASYSAWAWESSP